MDECSDVVEAREAPEVEPRRAARHLYWQGWRISSIAEHLGIARTTVHGWKDAEQWDKAQPIERVEGALEARLVQLIGKESKTGGDFKEIDLLGRQIERIARVNRYEKTGKEADLNPNIERRNSGPKKRPTRNDFSEDQAGQLRDAFHDSLFGHQKVWHRNSHERTRMVLKSRQVGATWYFAREALLDAIETGRNQIFLSASKAQAHIFKQYIVQFAREACGVDLTGDPIILPNGAHIYFLGTNARTAQGYHGNFYFDEFFWTNRFEELNKVASGMAMHKQWRKTYFSTPSSIQHPAYAYWSGDRFNKRRAKDQRIALDLSHARLAGGFTGEDRVWRNIVTILDAQSGGCDLFDIDELRLEYNSEEFANLLMCEFIDDTLSVFPMSELQGCMVDSWVDWANFYKPFTPRPYGHRPVWVGYDPSHTGDTAGCVVLAPPDKPGGKFRVLERHQWRGLDFEAQAEAIRQITLRYNVTFIGIDTTGLGQGVYQLVAKFFPAAKAINYSVEVKTRLVLKAKNVISKGRLEFDASWIDLAQAFLAIRRTLTASGRNVTYDAGRNEETGHADLAWACMHALDNEPLEGLTAANSGFMEIS
ncbi:terminase ATPase subunit family protein [Variovorax sp. PDNC026]|uniref:terminase ATPase subunit family protein n=1 Tax=Variovorax sp. PDNC026 TaxID=2811425 RepID=UPI00196254F3|nr:terminase ATPase subunit family protein [Variovorax sp. PDNC026]QRY30542.1 terminase ATPase subunit family protein [Variovorax sp. PDNC026]